jgi:hypothetical protein
MPQVVPPEMLIAEPHHHVVPMRGITQDRCRDPAAAQAGEQAAIGLPHGIQPPGNKIPRLFDDRHFPCPLAPSSPPVR